MTLGERLFRFFTVDRPLPGVASRFYPVTALQQGLAPFVAWTIISQTPIEAHTQALTGLRRWHVQLSVFSKDYDETRAVADALKVGIIGFREEFGIRSALLIGEHSLYEDDTKFHHIPVEIDIMENLQ